MGPFGLAPYGFRYETGLSAPASTKGKGFFGPLPSLLGGVSTEISAHDDNGNGFPLMAPSLNAQQLHSLLSGGQPNEDIYRAAQAWANARRAAGMSPFAQPNELRMPLPMGNSPSWSLFQ